LPGGKKVANLEKHSLLACSVREKEKAMKEDKERREQCEYFLDWLIFYLSSW